MSSYRLPIAAYVERMHLRFRIDLDGQGIEHVLELHFEPKDEQSVNTDGAWYLDVFNAAGEALLLGCKLALGTDRFAAYRYRKGMPKGRLDVIDTSGKGREASSTDLGTRVVLEYTPL